jgi:putative membrane protein
MSSLATRWPNWYSQQVELGQRRVIGVFHVHVVRFGLYSPGFHWARFLFFVLVLVLIVAAIAFLVQAVTRHRTWHHSTPGVANDRPEMILRERLARGEIDEDEYQRKAEILRRSPRT